MWNITISVLEWDIPSLLTAANICPWHRLQPQLAIFAKLMGRLHAFPALQSHPPTHPTLHTWCHGHNWWRIVWLLEPQWALLVFSKTCSDWFLIPVQNMSLHICYSGRRYFKFLFVCLPGRVSRPAACLFPHSLSTVGSFAAFDQTQQLIFPFAPSWAVAFGAKVSESFWRRRFRFVGERQLTRPEKGGKH